MLQSELDELNYINEARASAGDRTAGLVVRLVNAYGTVAQCYHDLAVKLVQKEDLIRRQAERIHAQSELLAKRAEGKSE